MQDQVATDMKEIPSRPRRDETSKLGNSREAISNKYAAIREQIRQSATTRPNEKSIASAKVSLLDPRNPHSDDNDTVKSPTSSLASTWATVKTGFSSFKSNIGSTKLIALRETNFSNPAQGSSSESLDDIFQRLKQPSINSISHDDDEDHDGLDDIKNQSPRR